MRRRPWASLLLLAACASSRVPGTAAAPSGAPDATAAATARLAVLHAEARERPDGAVLYAVAFYEAKLGRTGEALATLRRLDATGWDGGLADDAFPALASLPAYRSLAARIAARNPVVHRSAPGFTIAEPGLHAEGIAYDLDRRTFYVGSTTTGRIVAVDASGRARDVFRTGLREVLGLKVGGPGRALWAACNDDEHPNGDACVLAADPVSGAILRRACIQGPDHELNDLAIASDGTVYVTDSSSGAVLRLGPEATQLEPLVPEGRLHGTNGIALGAGDRVLLVAHGRGIARMDLATGAIADVAHAPSAAFVGIDGMSLRERALYAIANTYGRPRVVRIDLDPTLSRAESFEVLETENAEWDEPTTGALGPDGFYYVADSQLGSSTPPRSTIVLKVPYPS